MNRFNTRVTRAEDKVADAFNSKRSHLDDNNSPYIFYNANSSDPESISDDSRKIRKKRDTYQKISDDIRVQLLESVQNGETLKSAAKRFNINYSSAKSILHTYRKEGRILKKSAQERTTKRAGSPNDSEPQAKTVKPNKKEAVKSIKSNDKVLQTFVPYAERNISLATTSASHTDASSPATSGNASNEHFHTIMKADHYSQHKEGKKVSVEGPMIHSQALHREEEPAMNMMQYIDYGHMREMSHMNAPEALPKTSRNSSRLFDNFLASHPDFHYAGAEYMGEASAYQNHMPYTHHNEYDPYTDLMGAFQTRPHKAEEFSQYARGLNSFINREEKMGRAEAGLNVYDDNLESHPLKNYVDTQNMLLEAFRKTSNMGYNGNPSYRKNSFDMF